MGRSTGVPRRTEDARYTIVAEAGASPPGERFPFIAALDALEAWQVAPGSPARRQLRSALSGVAAAAGATGAHLEVTGEPLTPLALGVGTLTRRPSRAAAAIEFELRSDAEGIRLGTLWLDRSGPDAPVVVRALGRALLSAWRSAESREMTRRLEALDDASRAVAGVLSADRVLQAIVDSVRTLVGARYAALGTADQEGQIDRFITSGLSRAERERIGDPPHGHGLLGLLIREGRTLRVDEIGRHPSSHGFPPNHPPMRSLLGVPLVAKGKVVGDLYLTEKEGGAPFTARDERIAEQFALHAAIAIENARLHERISRLAVVEERERIGRDLHDGIIQSIYAVALSLDDAPELMASEPAEAEARVDRAIESLNLVIRDIRNFIFGLRPELLDRAGLTASLASLAEEFRLNTLIDLEVELDGRGAADLDDEATAQLLQVAREALSNAARHAKATRARLELTADPAGIRLVVADNGRGFDVGAARGPGHQGLANMRGRAAGIGGRLEVESAPGAGTRIIVTVPRGGAEGRHPGAEDGRPAREGGAR